MFTKGSDALDNSEAMTLLLLTVEEVIRGLTKVQDSHNGSIRDEQTAGDSDVEQERNWA